MAKIEMGYFDAAGKFHPTPREAVLSDISAILGRIGAEAGLTAGLAQVILEKRAEIEGAFRDLDHMENYLATHGAA